VILNPHALLLVELGGWFTGIVEAQQWAIYEQKLSSTFAGGVVVCGCEATGSGMRVVRRESIVGSAIAEGSK
jgi:hypothetical protein